MKSFKQQREEWEDDQKNQTRLKRFGFEENDVAKTQNKIRETDKETQVSFV